MVRARPGENLCKVARREGGVRVRRAPRWEEDRRPEGGGILIGPFLAKGSNAVAGLTVAGLETAL